MNARRPAGAVAGGLAARPGITATPMASERMSGTTLAMHAADHPRFGRVTAADARAASRA